MYSVLIVVVVCYFVRNSVNADCGIFTKAEWDGLRPTQVEYLPRPVKLVIVQHTVTPTCNSNEGCAELVRNIQTNHMEILKYWDIGPSFLIGGNGKVFEGSGWLHVGAHTYGFNKKSLGIAFIGNFNSQEPTEASLNALRNLIKCGVERGHLAPDYKLVAHKQLIATESPGRNLYIKIQQWPDWVGNLGSIKKKQR